MIRPSDKAEEEPLIQSVDANPEENATLVPNVVAPQLENPPSQDVVDNAAPVLDANVQETHLNIHSNPVITNPDKPNLRLKHIFRPEKVPLSFLIQANPAYTVSAGFNESVGTKPIVH